MFRRIHFLVAMLAGHLTQVADCLVVSTLSVFARIERGQGADLGKGHFCARPIILRALLRVILHFEGTMGK